MELPNQSADKTPLTTPFAENLKTMHQGYFSVEKGSVDISGKGRKLVEKFPKKYRININDRFV
jgi:hypothetical protein